MKSSQKGLERFQNSFGKGIFELKKQRSKVLVYALLMLFILSMSGNAWAAPANTNSSEQKSTDTQPALVFKDVQAGDNNLIYINYLAKREIISGFPDGGFHPNEGLSRAQAATLLVKAAGLSSSDKKTSFKDVDAGHWAVGSIAAAANAGYFKGYPDGTCHPEEKLSRAEGISLVLRLSKQKDTGAEMPGLSDLDSKHWAARSVAIGLAAGMVGLSSDKTQFLPDTEFSRGDLSRALAVLLTTDPNLSQTPLNGSLEIQKGEVKVNDQAVTGTVSIKAGDIIATSAGAEAQLSYPDGSGLLVKENTKLSVKETRGRAYIKKDGSPGTAVDWLLVDIKKGDVYGALATNPNVKEETSEKKTASLGEKLLAGLSSNIEYLAAGDKELPWYQSAEAKKVKVKVDMPYGVAAVRGSFWSNGVNANGCSTSALEGDVQVGAVGGQTVPVPAGQSSSINQGSTVPTPPAPMTAAQVSSWTQQSNWLQTVAQTMQNNQEAVRTEAVITLVGAPGQIPNAPITPQPSVIQPIPDIVTLVTQSLNQAQQNAGLPVTPLGTPQSTAVIPGGGTNTPEDSSSPAAGWRLENVASTVYNGQTVALTRSLYITPPAGVPQDSYYEIRMKSGSSAFELGGSKIGIPILRLAKVWEDPSKLFVVFRDNNGIRKAIYSLTGSGSSGTLSNLATKSISGKIDLQSPNVAPAGGLIIEVKASGDSIGGYFVSSQSVTMPAGQSTVNYTLNVPDNQSSGNGYYVNCMVKDSSNTDYPYTSIGISGVDVIAGSVSNKNLMISPGAYIHGSISLPAANTSQSCFNGLIIAKMISGSASFAVPFNIAENESSFDYHLPVSPGSSYNVCYLLSSGNNNDNYLNYINEKQFYLEGYYSNSGTVTSQDCAAEIAVTSCVPGIDLSVRTGYGYLISGNITLPEAAPNSGINLHGLWAQAESGGQYIMSNPYIPEGESSAAYALNIPDSGSYTISIGDWISSAASGIITSGVTAPPLYKLEPVAVTVYSANVSLNLPLSSIGSGSITGLSPSIVNGPALLLGGKVYGLGSSQYTAEVAAKATYNYWYFKCAEGKWYNLRSFSTATALSDANKVLESVVPIFGQIIGSLGLNPSPATCPAGCSSITVSAATGSGLWSASDDVKAILANAGNAFVVPGGPITADSKGTDTAAFIIPTGVATGNYVLTLYKVAGGVYTLLGTANISIN